MDTLREQVAQLSDEKQLEIATFLGEPCVKDEHYLFYNIDTVSPENMARIHAIVAASKKNRPGSGQKSTFDPDAQKKKPATKKSYVKKCDDYTACANNLL